MSLDLQSGDVVRVTRTIQVYGVTVDGWLEGRDVRSGHYWAARHPDDSSLRIEMVKRVARRKPQRGDFKNGDKVTADQLREVMWRRGTMICPNHHPAELASVLHGDGRWHALNGEEWDFAAAAGKFELLYLPE